METTELAEKKPEEAYAVMDIFDEDLIRQELGGTLVDDLVYEFEMEGKKVRGLSSPGWIQVARMAIQSTMRLSILMDKPVIEEKEKSWKASVKVTLLSPNGNRLEMWASKVQSKTIYRKDGSIAKENDPNAEQIAETKAQRNAIAKAFPPKTATEFMMKLITEGKVKVLGPEEVETAKRKVRYTGTSKAEESKKEEPSTIKPKLGSFLRDLPRPYEVNSSEFYEQLDAPITELAVQEKLIITWRKDADGFIIAVKVSECPDQTKEKVMKRIDEIIASIPSPLEEGRLD